MDSIGKIKPSHVLFFEKKREGRLHYLVLVSFYLPFFRVGRGGLEMWSGHFNFRSFFYFIFFMFFFSKIGEFFFYGDYYLRYLHVRT